DRGARARRSTMAIEVAKVVLKHVQDASGLEERIRAGQFSADEVVAVIGKTEGNGGVNDFTRILADNAFRAALTRHGKRSAQQIRALPMVWSARGSGTGCARPPQPCSPGTAGRVRRAKRAASAAPP